MDVHAGIHAAVHVGDVVRVTMRSGRVLVGTVAMWWPVRSGGICVKVVREDGPPDSAVPVELELLECGHELPELPMQA